MGRSRNRLSAAIFKVGIFEVLLRKIGAYAYLLKSDLWTHGHADARPSDAAIADFAPASALIPTAMRPTRRAGDRGARNS